MQQRANLYAILLVLDIHNYYAATYVCLLSQRRGLLDIVQCREYRGSNNCSIPRYDEPVDNKPTMTQATEFHKLNVTIFCRLKLVHDMMPRARYGAFRLRPSQSNNCSRKPPAATSSNARCQHMPKKVLAMLGKHGLCLRSLNKLDIICGS